MAWDYDGAPPVGASLGTVTAVEGVTFCISDRDGDVRSGTQQGLFFRDTRFASTWALSIDRLTLHHLAVRRPAPYAATFIGLRPPRAGVADSTLLVVRHRYVGNGILERIVVRNLGKETAAVGLALSVEADFAGLFEVKEGRVTERGGVECTVQDRTMVLD